MELTGELKEKIKNLQAIYPDKMAALIPALHLTRDKFNIITPELEAQLAELFGLDPVRVQSVASFYSMLNRSPRGKYDLKFCRTLACSMLGGESIMGYAGELLGIKPGQVTSDGKFSITPVECLGSCGTAPVMQVNNEPFIENLTREKLKTTIEKLRNS